MTREEAIRCFWYFSNVADSGKNVVALTRRDKKVFDMAIEALSAEPCRESGDYENEIADLHNRLDIAEYDKEQLREEVTVLEEKLKSLSAEPYEDCISREAVIEALNSISGTAELDKAFEVIENMPSLITSEKVGKWIEKYKGCCRPYQCSNCKSEHLSDRKSDFCPDCGAKMAESEGEE